MTAHSFESIVDALASRQQRATYGAVAGVLSTSPRGLMLGRPRDPRHSWIVSKGTGQPTGYAPEQMDPALATRAEVLQSGEALLAWLETLQ